MCVRHALCSMHLSIVRVYRFTSCICTYLLWVFPCATHALCALQMQFLKLPSCINQRASLSARLEFQGGGKVQPATGVHSRGGRHRTDDPCARRKPLGRGGKEVPASEHTSESDVFRNRSRNRESEFPETHCEKPTTGRASSPPTEA